MILLLGAQGFVGSAFSRLFSDRKIAHEAITRDSYPRAVGRSASILINASTNSRKYLADQDWQSDFEASVASVVRTLRDFSADLYVLLSSVDVYNVFNRANFANPNTTFGSAGFGRITALATGATMRRVQLVGRLLF